MNRSKHGILGLLLRVIMATALLTAFATCTLEGDIKAVREKMEGGGSSGGGGSNSGIVPGSNLSAKLSWLQSNAQNGGNYIVEVNTNESISGTTTLSYSGKSNITITLRGVGTNRTINGSLSARSGVTLVLDNNITLQGGSVSAASGGTLVMNTGSAVIDGGGVYVSYSTFTMNGGIISGNTGTFAGGVHVDYEGIFTMNGGTISDNTNTSTWGGGGVGSGGTFIMNGGTISGNNAYRGAGVSVRNGTSAMSGTFTMNGGTIIGNTASYYGGGVHVDRIATFIMSSGTISGNTSSFGGGVYVSSEGTFSKTNGTIYGYSASDTANSNVVKNSSGAVINGRGHAVYADISSSSNKRKETTAGPSVNLSYNGSNGSFSGGWDY